MRYNYPHLVEGNAKLESLFDALFDTVYEPSELEPDRADLVWLQVYMSLSEFTSGELKRLAALWNPTPLAEGSQYSGNYGHPGMKGKGGSTARGVGVGTKVRLSRHAFERMGERRKYQSVKAGLAKLKGKDVPDGEWHMGVKRKGRLDAVLVGVDGVVKTVLGPWAKNLKGDDLGED